MQLGADVGPQTRVAGGMPGFQIGAVGAADVLGGAQGVECGQRLLAAF